MLWDDEFVRKRRVERYIGLAVTDIKQAGGDDSPPALLFEKYLGQVDDAVFQDKNLYRFAGRVHDPVFPDPGPLLEVGAVCNGGAFASLKVSVKEGSNFECYAIVVKCWPGGTWRRFCRRSVPPGYLPDMPDYFP